MATKNLHAFSNISVVRACLPEVMFVPDMALALGGVSERTARRTIVRGECGPYVRLGRRLVVRRESFLAALAAREVDPREPDNDDGGAS